MIDPAADPGLLMGSIFVLIAAIGHAAFGAAIVFALSTALSEPLVWDNLKPIIDGLGLPIPITPLIIGAAVGLFFCFFLIFLILQVLCSSKCLSVTNLLCLLINFALFGAIAAAGIVGPAIGKAYVDPLCAPGGTLEMGDLFYEAPLRGGGSSVEFCTAACICNGDDSQWGTY